MPTKPKRPCAYPGCPNLTDGQYCEEHRVQERRKYDKYERSPDVHKKYGRAWKRIRDSYVKTHPFCEVCYEKGVLVEVEEAGTGEVGDGGVVGHEEELAVDIIVSGAVGVPPGRFHRNSQGIPIKKFPFLHGLAQVKPAIQDQIVWDCPRLQIVFQVFVR